MANAPVQMASDPRDDEEDRSANVTVPPPEPVQAAPAQSVPVQNSEPAAMEENNGFQPRTSAQPDPQQGVPSKELPTLSDKLYDSLVSAGNKVGAAFDTTKDYFQNNPNAFRDALGTALTGFRVFDKAVTFGSDYRPSETAARYLISGGTKLANALGTLPDNKVLSTDDLRSGFDLIQKDYDKAHPTVAKASTVAGNVLPFVTAFGAARNILGRGTTALTERFAPKVGELFSPAAPTTMGEASAVLSKPGTGPIINNLGSRVTDGINKAYNTIYGATPMQSLVRGGGSVLASGGLADYLEKEAARQPSNDNAARQQIENAKLRMREDAASKNSMPQGGSQSQSTFQAPPGKRLLSQQEYMNRMLERNVNFDDMVDNLRKHSALSGEPLPKSILNYLETRPESPKRSSGGRGSSRSSNAGTSSAPNTLSQAIENAIAKRTQSRLEQWEKNKGTDEELLKILREAQEFTSGK